jgi:hypothetical protein
LRISAKTNQFIKTGADMELLLQISGSLSKMQGTTGLDIILIILFVYISYKLIKRYKKESEGKR